MNDSDNAIDSEIERLKGERDLAIKMLAEWCVAVKENGTGWDDWDEYYKDAMYRPGPLRELIDAAVKEAKDERAKYLV